MTMGQYSYSFNDRFAAPSSIKTLPGMEFQYLASPRLEVE